MLGLQPRLKARNSLWDLVNKHPSNLLSSSSQFRKQPVEEGVDGLPPLPFSPSLPNSPSLEQRPHHHHPSESSAPFTMAPVSSTTCTLLCDRAKQAIHSQRKIRNDLGRRLAKSNMVGLHIGAERSAYKNWILLIMLYLRIHLLRLRVCSLQENAMRMWSNI